MAVIQVTTAWAQMSGLTVGTRYALQNQGGNDVHLHFGSAVPNADEDDFGIIAKHTDDTPWSGLRLLSGQNAYVRTQRGGAKLFYSEAP